MSSSPFFRQSCLLFLTCIAASKFVKAYNDHQPPVAPPTNFTPGPDISFDRFFTIDTAQLAAPPGFTGLGDCNISPSSLVQNGTVMVILPPTINDNNTDSFEDIHTQTLMVSLLYLFEQIGVQQEEIPKLVERGIPLFAVAVKESLCPTQSGSLARRSIFDDIAGFIEDVGNAIVGAAKSATVDVGCSIFAASALPGYLTVAGLLHVQNIRQIPIASTPDQDFFIFPLHGPISHNDRISIVYSANLPPGFGDSMLGVTIGRNIYVRQSADTRFMENGGFPNATRNLLPRGSKNLNNDTGSVNFFKPLTMTPPPLLLLPKIAMLDSKRQFQKKTYHIFALQGARKTKKPVHLNHAAFLNVNHSRNANFLGNR